MIDGFLGGGGGGAYTHRSHHANVRARKPIRHGAILGDYVLSLAALGVVIGRETHANTRKTQNTDKPLCSTPSTSSRERERATVPNRDINRPLCCLLLFFVCLTTSLSLSVSLSLSLVCVCVCVFLCVCVCVWNPLQQHVILILNNKIPKPTTIVDDDDVVVVQQ